MFKNKFFQTGKKQEDDNQWMLEKVYASEELKRENSSNASFSDGSSSEEDSDDEDSDCLMTEKKIYTNEHKHLSEAHHDFRWSIKPDARISCGANTMKAKKPAARKMTMNTMGTIMMSMRKMPEADVCLSSDDEDLYMDEDIPTSELNEVPNEKPVMTSQPEEAPQKEEILNTEEVVKKKKKKKKKKSDINNSSGSRKTVDSNIRTSGVSIGSKKGKKKVGKKGKKKLGENSEEIKVEKKKKKKKTGSEELEVAKRQTQRVSLRDRIRASFAMIGDRSRGLPKNALDKLDMVVIQQSEEEEPTTSSCLVEEQKKVQTEQQAIQECSEDPPEAPATPKTAKGGGLGSPKVALSPLQKFRGAGQKMRTIVATVDEMLADLQQYEAQLEQERNQLAEDREMMILQQESVEQLLETENETTRQLEARVLELENMLENELYRKENDGLMMKVQMLEAEVERQEAAFANLATEQQQVLKRGPSMNTLLTASISNFSAADSAPDCWMDGSSGSEEEDPDENDYESTSAPIPNAAKHQGELLQLRSSFNHKDTVIEEQAKEITRLREQVEQSQQDQRLSQVEATCEDFRNENKQFRAEVQELKKELAEVEAARQAEIIKVEGLLQADAKKTQALKKAEEEKDEALRKLETHLLLNLKTTKTRESTINNVLDIGAPAQYPPILSSTTETNGDAIAEEPEEIEESEEESESNQVVPEKKNWFGFGGGDSSDDGDNNKKESEHEKKNWFGFGGNDEDGVVQEEEGSGWFGFGKKEKEESLELEKRRQEELMKQAWGDEEEFLEQQRAQQDLIETSKSHVEATCEDFRNENKQLSQELAKEKTKAARQAELVEVERLKQSTTAKTQALKKAEEELRQLETLHPLTMNTTKTVRQSTINKVLEIGAPAQYGTISKIARVDFAGGITNAPTGLDLVEETV